MRGKSLHLRLSQLTIDQVNDLARWMGARKATVVTIAVERLHQQARERREVDGRSDREVQGER